MNNEAYLMSQFAKRRTLKEKYLRPRTGAANPLTARVMTNAMFLAIKERVDLFGLIRRLCVQTEPGGAVTLDDALDWVQSLADELGCGVYELFIDDPDKRRRQLGQLLQALENCDGWEDIQPDEQGGGSFVLPGFDYAFRMAERPMATLVFEKTAQKDGAFHYTLSLGAPSQPMDPIPSQGVLWSEQAGLLQQFIDRTLTDLSGGWQKYKPVLDQLSQQIAAHGEALKDLAAIINDLPEGMSITPLLTQTLVSLRALRAQAQAVLEQLPESIQTGSRGKQGQNMLLLLGGAIKLLEGMTQTGGDHKQLSEAVYLLENAAAPL